MTVRLSRREAIAAGGAVALGGATWALLRDGDDDGQRAASSAAADDSTTTADCVLTPEQTEGPYYLDEGLVRRDITEGRPGVPLTLGLKVQDAECAPLSGATVEVWHADAGGVYSGFGEGEGETFLRGGQPTGDDGVASLETIYPGWYAGRTVHIHVKVHLDGDEVHTGQLYFDDAITDRVYRDPPYSSRGERDVTNETDAIYAAGGADSMLRLTADGDGYVGRLTVGVQT